MFFPPFPRISAFAGLPRRGAIADRVVRGNLDEGANFGEKSFIISWFAVIPAAPARRRQWSVSFTAATLRIAVAGIWRVVFRVNARRSVEGPSSQ